MNSKRAELEMLLSYLKKNRNIGKLNSIKDLLDYDKEEQELFEYLNKLKTNYDIPLGLNFHLERFMLEKEEKEFIKDFSKSIWDMAFDIKTEDSYVEIERLNVFDIYRSWKYSQSLIIITYSGFLFTYSMGNDKDITKVYIESSPMENNKLYFWQIDHNNSVSNFYMLEPNLSKSQLLRGCFPYPLLVLSTSFLFEGQKYDIENVLSVDCFSINFKSESIVYFSILAEISSPFYPTNKFTADMNDAESDFDLHDDRISINSDSNEGDSHQKYFNTCESYIYYSVIFLIFLRGKLSIIGVNRLSPEIEVDQRPLKIFFASKDNVVVSGTNGLLGLFRCCLPANLLDLREKRQRFSYFNLNKDNSLNQEFSFHSHNFDACVSFFGYLNKRNILISGDSNGIICFWKLHKDNNFNKPFKRIDSFLNNVIISLHVIDVIDSIIIQTKKGLFYLSSDDLDCPVELFKTDVTVIYPKNFIFEIQDGQLKFWEISSLHYLKKESTETGSAIRKYDVHRHKSKLRMESLSSRLEINSEMHILPFFKNHPNECLTIDLEEDFYNMGSIMEKKSHLPKNNYNTKYLSDHGMIDISESSFYFDMEYSKLMFQVFNHPHSILFKEVEYILSILCCCFSSPSISLISCVYEKDELYLKTLIETHLRSLILIKKENNQDILSFSESCSGIQSWLCSYEKNRAGKEFWIDPSKGHNFLCYIYLKYCGNKSVATEHQWQAYLKTYGPFHLRKSSRGLRYLTMHIRKIDETANIKSSLPRQLGYISGLQEIYARRVGLCGQIPKELGQLENLRVLSMGNNFLSGILPKELINLKNMQRIVLHQNNLEGEVPSGLAELGCIVNLAGNPKLVHGREVPEHEKEALKDLFRSTKGYKWNIKNNWMSPLPVGVLASQVHSIVMSNNGMEGFIPSSIENLKSLRMIEFATMTGLSGPIPKEICLLVTLKRLCICRCSIEGEIPNQIGSLSNLEELQLFGNRLTGRIPDSIRHLKNLKLLSLGEYTGGNDFGPAELPECIRELTQLEALFMANCNIIGRLPRWIGELSELRQLDLQKNYLDGPIPPEIGQLKNLLYFNLKDNIYLNGKLPIFELCSLKRLNRLSLVHCKFDDSEDSTLLLKKGLPNCKIWI